MYKGNREGSLFCLLAGAGASGAGRSRTGAFGCARYGHRSAGFRDALSVTRVIRAVRSVCVVRGLGVIRRARAVR